MQEAKAPIRYGGTVVLPTTCTYADSHTLPTHTCTQVARMYWQHYPVHIYYIYKLLPEPETSTGPICARCRWSCSDLMQFDLVAREHWLLWMMVRVVARAGTTAFVVTFFSFWQSVSVHQHTEEGREWPCGYVRAYYVLIIYTRHSVYIYVWIIWIYVPSDWRRYMKSILIFVGSVPIHMCFGLLLWLCETQPNDVTVNALKNLNLYW